ncbi:MAG TPA: 16S rRNA (cytosine(1402)-N(4))-methyltransferase RsmH [Terriglobia bacterium]|nr:16S rRNA (cytosine(1402)-N(4))-methyltransferase RsmH [Terriglobia bacterium]
MHVPVLVREVLEYLAVRTAGTYIDATVNGGGHAEAILRSSSGARLLGIDRDAAMLDAARQRLAPFEGSAVLVQGNFAEIKQLHHASGFPPADGLIADLGLSSNQLDEAGRGFSFEREGALDMRMDASSSRTASDLVNHLPERELADLIFQLGEERHSRRIARAIMKARPIHKTTELAQVVARAIPPRTGLHPIHPATRTFMALRMAVNDEMGNLEAFLDRSPGVLGPGGRMVVISFHSLEDRKVKQNFLKLSREGRARLLTKKICRPTDAEMAANPRSRSAKLRAMEMTGMEPKLREE